MTKPRDGNSSRRDRADRSERSSPDRKQRDRTDRSELDPTTPSDVGRHVATVTRTLNVPAAAVFTAFFDPPRRATWCHRADYNVRHSSRPAGLRIAWPDNSLVVVSITRQGNSRCTVRVEHDVGDAAKVAQARQDWSDSLDRLRSMMDA